MILDCPLCRTRYLVQAKHFVGAGGRQVRCARCKHSWQVGELTPMELASIKPDVQQESPQEVTPIPPGSNLPVPQLSPLERLWQLLRPYMYVALCGTILLILVQDRQHLAHHWKFLVPVYDTFHLSIYYPGEELDFNDVRSDLKFEGGIVRLNLSGKVTNPTKNNQKVPDIIAEAIGADGRTMQSWQIDAPKATLAPGEEVEFQSSINAPKGNIVNVNLKFAEIKNDE